MDAREFITRTSGQDPGGGINVELSFDEMGESPKSLAKRAGKVGIRASLTEFFKAALGRRRAPNPIAPNQADIVNWIIYDRFQFAASTTVPNKFQFYTQPIGTNNKTKVDTNLDQVQRLPDPLWFNSTGIGFFFNPNLAPADYNQFIATEYFEYWVGQKVYIEGPPQCFPGGAGPWASLSNTDMVVNGYPATHNVYDLRLPAGLQLGNDVNGAQINSDGLLGVTILQGQQFHVDFNAPMGGAALIAPGATPVAGSGLTIMSYLYGILSRGVQ